MYTDKQLSDLHFKRRGQEQHLVIGPYANKPHWPEQITRNYQRPRLIIRGRWLFFVPNAVWKEMCRYPFMTGDKRTYFGAMWDKCARMRLPLQSYCDFKRGYPNWDVNSYRVLTELVEKVQAGQWVEPHFYDED